MRTSFHIQIHTKFSHRKFVGIYSFIMGLLEPFISPGKGTLHAKHELKLERKDIRKISRDSERYKIYFFVSFFSGFGVNLTEETVEWSE